MIFGFIFVVACIALLIKILGGLARLATTKSCPDCCEGIDATANVCKHCGYRFNEKQTDDIDVSNIKISAER